MLSMKLVHLIETHWEEIAERLVGAVRKHPEMRSLAMRPEIEIREWCKEILENLGYMLTVSNEDEAQRRFEVLGRMRFEENIPLHEAVLRLHMLKDKIVGFVHEQGFPMNALQLYAEEELELRMGRFFDAMVYHVVRGYEDAQRVAALIAAYQPEVPASTLPTSLVTQMNLNLISNSRGERVVAEAHWLSHNGRQWVSETEVRDDTGHLVLQCTSTHVPLA